MNKFNEQDAKFARIVDGHLLVDFRKSRASKNDQHIMVRGIANRYFWGSSDGLVKEKSGTLLGGNLLQVYHVSSVAKGLWIVSLQCMEPTDTQPIAKKYVLTF